MAADEIRRRERGAEAMVELICPWCEAKLEVPVDAQRQEQSCPECLTSWAYELAQEREMANAA